MMGRRQALRNHFRGCRMLPCMDAFPFFASSRAKAYAVLLHEDNMGVVVHVFANLAFRSPLLMTELQKLCFILDSNDISIRARYIKTTANIWADRLIREIDYDD
eukprot:jgi/Tetstr1/439987/TSEL_028348.t1